MNLEKLACKWGGVARGIAVAIFAAAAFIFSVGFTAGQFKAGGEASTQAQQKLDERQSEEIKANRQAIAELAKEMRLIVAEQAKSQAETNAQLREVAALLKQHLAAAHK